MIKFFQKIRQNLLNQGKTRKYLTYALGEIVLVVIGILIALQINNWNEVRKEKQQEKIYLSRIVEELTTDFKTISRAIYSLKSRQKRAEFLMKTVQNPQLVQDSAHYFISSIEYAGYTSFPIISDNTFEEIKSSGKLSLITNETIRSTLQQYYSWTSKRNQYNFIREDLQLSFLKEKQGILTADQEISLGSFKQSRKFNSTEAKLVYEQMLQKPNFLSLLPSIIKSQVRTGETFEDVQQEAVSLKNTIQKELNKQ